MGNTLAVTTACCSLAGTKPANEDACALRVPEAAELLHTKGIAAVIADGMSGSDAGREASHACAQGFVSDYFSTPESWTVKTAGGKVLSALNRWLHGQGQREYGSARGMVSTASVLVLKSASAHIFHVGDTRIYRLRGDEFEQLTRDHRVRVSGDKTYLSRAVGIELNVEIDYRSLAMEAGDVYLLTSDGIHDFLRDRELHDILVQHADDPDAACRRLAETALARGSDDNCSCLLVRVDAVTGLDKHAVYQQLTELPFPPPLSEGMVLDGFRILRELHASKRTELFLALDEASGRQVVLKVPSVNYSDDPTYIEMFLHEGWVGRRLRNQHVLKVLEPSAQRRFLYHVEEYIEGQTLRQWMRDHPLPAPAEVRPLLEQLAAGVRAFHRMEMIHQDLKPENVMIDPHGTVKIVDFGSTKIGGVEEIASPLERPALLGTENYTAPEYLAGYPGSNRADIYSVGVIAYEMLTGKLPYGDHQSARRRHARYAPATHYNPAVPAWVDGALRKAVQRSPDRRYDSLSEFMYDLSHPNPRLVDAQPRPLLERNPTAFWRGLAIALLVVVVVLLVLLLR